MIVIWCLQVDVARHRQCDGIKFMSALWHLAVHDHERGAAQTARMRFHNGEAVHRGDNDRAEILSGLNIHCRWGARSAS